MAVAPVTVADEADVAEEPRDKAAAVVAEILTGYPARAAFAEAGMSIELVVEGDEHEPVVSIRVGNTRYVDVFVRSDGA